MTRRLAVCYAAPGLTLLSTSGPTRNILSVAEAMSEWADVTVAFRRLAETVGDRAYQAIAIEPDPVDAVPRDDVAVRGLNPVSHAAFLWDLRQFASKSSRKYDLVFEKGWRFSGYLARQFLRRGVPGILIENDVRYWSEPVRKVRDLGRYVAQKATQMMAGYCSRSLPLIIAETEELREALVALHGIAPDRIEVVELGVDHSLFGPRDQDSVRRSIGIEASATVMLYVGGMDIYHDLGPVIEAMGELQDPRLELHVVGDGALRSSNEEQARRMNIRARFYGQLPHRTIPDFIAASDLCLAPYQPSRFYANKITFSTLKIPEYMACARTVVSVPHGHIARLIEPGVTGFLIENEVHAWSALLRALPPRERLAEMGRRAAQRVASISWERTGSRYLELGRRVAAGL